MRILKKRKLWGTIVAVILLCISVGSMVYGQEVYKGVWVDIRIESHDSTMMVGRVQANNLMEAVQRFGQQNKVEIVVEETEYGSYVSSIGGVKEKTFDGMDGWSGFVVRKDIVVEPQTAWSEIPLQTNDEIVIYYMSFGRTKVPTDLIIKETDGKWGIKCASTSTRWEQEGEQWVAKMVTENLTDINAYIQRIDSDKVLSFKTDKDGYASIGTLAPGVYTYYVDGYISKDVPTVVKSSKRVFLVGISNTSELSRGEFISLLVKSNKLPKALHKVSFTDVTANTKYADEILAAAAAGLIKGYSDMTFRPEAPISLLEAVILVGRLYPIQEVKETVALKDVPAWAKASVQAAMDQRALRNITLNWKQPLTSKNAAKLFENLMK